MYNIYDAEFAGTNELIEIKCGAMGKNARI
jgi:hypothetical protein